MFNNFITFMLLFNAFQVYNHTGLVWAGVISSLYAVYYNFPRIFRGMSDFFEYVIHKDQFRHWGLMVVGFAVLQVSMFHIMYNLDEVMGIWLPIGGGLFGLLGLASHINQKSKFYANKN